MPEISTSSGADCRTLAGHQARSWWWAKECRFSFVASSSPERLLLPTEWWVGDSNRPSSTYNMAMQPQQPRQRPEVVLAEHLLPKVGNTSSNVLNGSTGDSASKLAGGGASTRTDDSMGPVAGFHDGIDADDGGGACATNHASASGSGCWSPTTWRKFPARQQAPYASDGVTQGALVRVRGALARLPPLVSAVQVDALRKRLAACAEGAAFCLTGGDCAESFASCTADKVNNKLRVLAHMRAVISQLTRLPVVVLARLAGQ